MADDSAEKPTASFRRRLLSSGGIALVGKLSAMVCFVLSYWLLCRRYDDPQTASYLLLQSLAMIGGMIATWGMGPVMIRTLRQAQREQLDAGTVVRTSLLIFCCIAVIAVICLVSLVLFTHFLKVDLKPYAGFLAAWIVLAGLSQLLGETLRGFERFVGAASLSGGQNGGMLTNILFFCMLLTLSSKTPFVFVLWLQLAAMTVTCCIGIITLRSVMSKQDASAPPIEISAARMLREGGPIFVSQLTVVGFVQFETLLVGVFAGPADIAAYGAIRRMMTIVGAPLLLINSALPTFVADLFDQKRMEKLETLLRTATTLAMLPALALLLLMMIAPQQVLGWFDPGYGQFRLALLIMCAGQIVFVLAGSSGLALRMTGHQKLAMYSAIVATVVYLLIAPPLISSYGILGAAISGCTIVAMRNISGAILVKYAIGIWTIPKLSLLSPQAIKLLRRAG